MIRRLLFCIFLCLFCFPGHAEDEPEGIRVTSFKVAETDMDARVNYPELDINNKKCAIIKVQTTRKGFSFDTGVISVTKVEQKIGEIWVYVSPGVRKLNIYHQDYGVCRYEMPNTAKEATVYLVKLKLTRTSDQTDKGKPAVSADAPPATHTSNTPDNAGNRLVGLNEERLLMVKVDGGRFLMGEGGSGIESQPYHFVTLNDYFIGQTEVTEALWHVIMGGGTAEQVPAKRTYEQWQDFITCLNERMKNVNKGLVFRLPTEAEWEFAARGGVKTRGYVYPGSNNLDEVAWYLNNASEVIRKPGGKMANELGLYDMGGNVWEWCSDWWGIYQSAPQTNPRGPRAGNMKVVRGGDVKTSNKQWIMLPGRACAALETKVGLRLVLSANQ